MQETCSKSTEPKAVFTVTEMNNDYLQGNTRGAVANVLDCDIIVGELELLSRHYIDFLTNRFGKDITPLSSQLWIK